MKNFLITVTVSDDPGETMIREAGKNYKNAEKLYESILTTYQGVKDVRTVSFVQVNPSIPEVKILKEQVVGQGDS